jgi:protein arginine N-methyltransferase 1
MSPRRWTRKNGFETIKFISSHSSKFELTEKADVIIQEQIGDYLFEENMIENILDLRDRVLKKGGRILPSKFEFFVEPVELQDDYRTPFLWEHHDIKGVDYSFLKNLYLSRMPKSYFYRSIAPRDVKRFLCDRAKVLDFDLLTLQVEDLPHNVHYERPVTQDARLDGFAIFFNVMFDDEIGFSNAPQATNTSWVGRMIRVESKYYKQGQTIGFELDIDEFNDPNTWRWSVS